MIKSVFTVSLALFVYSQASMATLQVTGIDGASAYDLTTSATLPVIYGGTAGTNCSASADSIYDTCDSCASLTGLSICNLTRIYNGLRLRIYFQSDAVAGTAFLKDKEGNLVSLSPATTSKAVGETHTIDILWSDMCAAASDGTTCEDVDISNSVTIGVDSSADTTEDTLQISIKVHDPDTGSTGNFDTIEACTAASVTQGGICDFIAYPGDAKVYIKDLGASDGFPTSGNITIKALRFFMSNDDNIGGWISNPNQVTPIDLEVETNAEGLPETTSRVLDGATNDVLHYVRVAVVDQANNVSRFTSDQAIIDYCGPNALTGAPNIGCIFYAKPSEVIGLLEDDLNCFITSVAYGSGLDQRVDVFRTFRSQVLQKFSWGKSLIRFYYKKGPYAAAWLVQHPHWKPIVRTFLWPALGLAWTANHLGLTFALTVFFVLLMAFVFVLKIFVRRFKNPVANEN